MTLRSTSRLFKVFDLKCLFKQSSLGNQTEKKERNNILIIDLEVKVKVILGHFPEMYMETLLIYNQPRRLTYIILILINKGHKPRSNYNLVSICNFFILISIQYSTYNSSHQFNPRFWQCQTFSVFSSVCLSVWLYVLKLLQEHYAQSHHF